jgi:hypothetical protein
MWILLGLVSGMVMGMFFHRENWLGGYTDSKRRLKASTYFGQRARNCELHAA